MCERKYERMCESVVCESVCERKYEQVCGMIYGRICESIHVAGSVRDCVMSH